MPQILFVCTGNTCRSPAAAALLQARLQAEGLLDWTVSSMGIQAQEGEPASALTVHLMAERGIDMSEHRSRAFDIQAIDPLTLILCMEQRHVDWIEARRPERYSFLFKLSEMSNQQLDVPDPFGGSLHAYRKMMADLEALIDAGFLRMMTFG